MSVSYKNLNVAVVGCGNWGKNLIRVFHQLGALKAVCDSDHTKASSFSEQYQVPQYSFASLLKQPDIDGIVIATPSYTHFELGYCALKAHKHVFMEKPLALQEKEALALHILSEQQKRTLMVGHLLQYHPVFVALKNLKRDGILGDLQHIYSHRFNFGKFPSEKSVLVDFAPHDISMVLSLVGDMPQSVSAVGGNYFQHSINDTARVHLNFHSNIQAHIFVTWLHPYKEQKLIVVGNKAMAIFDDCQPWESKLRLIPYPSEWEDGLPRPFPPNVGENIIVPRSEPLLNECAHFLDCIQSRAPALTDGSEGRKVMAVLEAAEQSMASHQWIELSPPNNISKQSDTFNFERVLEGT